MASWTGIGGALGGWFGSKDLADAYDEAYQEYIRFRGLAEQQLQGFTDKGAATYDRFTTALTNPEMAPDIAQLRQFLTTSIQSGLSPAAQLYMQDATRALNTNLSRTGNLRSGTATLLGSQIAQRVTADEFTRALNTVNTFRQGDIAGANILGQTALGYGQLQDQALGILGQALPSGQQAKIGQGMAQYAGSVAMGQFAGGLVDKGEEYAKMYMTGGLSNLMGSGGGGGSNG